jgi:hypothetical protein
MRSKVSAATSMGVSELTPDLSGNSGPAAFLPLSGPKPQSDTYLMTPILLLILFLIAAGVAGNLGWIKTNSDPEHPEPPIIGHS